MLAALLTPVQALYSKALYQRAYRQWRGKGFGYLFLLQAASLALFCLHFHIKTNQALLNELPKFSSQVPRITIEHGKASIDAEQPYLLTETDTPAKIPFAVLDTTGKVKTLAEAQATYGSSVKLLLTETELVMQNNPREQRIFQLKEVREKFVIDRNKITEWSKLFVTLFAPGMFLLGLPFIYLGRLILGLLYALAGLVQAHVLGREANFAGIYQVAILAMTPSILLNAATNLGMPEFPGFHFVCFIATIVYLVWGVDAATAPETEPGTPVGPPSLPPTA